MTENLYDTIYDGIRDTCWEIDKGNYTKAKEILERLESIVTTFRVQKYLDKLKLKREMLDTYTNYGYINIEKNGKKGYVIL